MLQDCWVGNTLLVTINKRNKNRLVWYHKKKTPPKLLIDGPNRQQYRRFETIPRWLKTSVSSSMSVMNLLKYSTAFSKSHKGEMLDDIRNFRFRRQENEVFYLKGT